MAEVNDDDGFRRLSHTLIIPITDTCTILQRYEVAHPIWGLDEEKRIRQAIADTQRDLIVYADEAVKRLVTVRG